MNIKSIAYNFILNNKIKNFSINLDELTKIIKNNGWEIFSFKQNLTLIKELNLEEKINSTLGFTYVFKTINNGKVSTKNIIFYKDELPLKDKYFIILHEIGHIVLNHLNNTKTLNKSKTLLDLESEINIETEADLFACEVLAPSCVLKNLKLTNFNDIKIYTLIPELYINKYLLEIHKSNSENKTFLNSKVLFLYFKYKLNFHLNNLKKFPFFKFSPLIILFLVALFIFIGSNFSFSRDPNADILSYTKKNNIELYVTKTGSRYHTDGCHHLKNSSYVSITYKELKNSEYLPCKTCFKIFFKN